ncbi:unnamed protein product [Sphagnum balticum]
MWAGNEQVFTGGAEGVVRRWSFQELLKGKAAEAEEDLHEEPIWDLIANEKRGILVTSSADETHKVIRCGGAELEEVGVIESGDVPTSIDWIGEGKFVSGFVNKPSLRVYDIETGACCWDYSFEGRGALYQTNRVQTSIRQKLVAAGNEDHYIRFYDAGTSRCEDTQISV